MIDPTVQRLLEDIIDSPVKLQLVLMFYENKRMQGTTLQIAERIYRDIWSTREALRELSEDGILMTCGMLGEPAYCYQPDPQHTDAIRRLYQAYNEPLERDQLQRLVREVASYAPYRRAAHGMFAFERI